MARYSNLSRTDVDHILGRYSLVEYTSEPLAGGAANSSYLVRTDQATYVLTVLDNHEQESAQRLAELLEYLATQGIPTTRPIRTADGSSLTHWVDRPVLVKEYITGRSGILLPADRFGAAGETLAQVHAVLPPTYLPTRGRRLPSDWAARATTFPDQGFAQWLRSQWERASRVERLAGPHGLVHGDYFADNLVISNDGGIAVLDWETATNDLLVLDIGMAIVGLCRENGSFLPDQAVDLLRGYERCRRLGDDEKTYVYDAVRYASLVIAYHRYVRHHLAHPDASKQHLYLEIPRFIESLDDLWPKTAGWHEDKR